MGVGMSEGETWERGTLSAEKKKKFTVQSGLTHGSGKHQCVLWGETETFQEGRMEGEQRAYVLRTAGLAVH